MENINTQFASYDSLNVLPQKFLPTALDNPGLWSFNLYTVNINPPCTETLSKISDFQLILNLSPHRDITKALQRCVLR